MDLYYTVVFFIFGTIFGSFYNVVGDRLPVGKSIVKPSSHCPFCKHKLGAFELIPIISYLIQLGKCKNCGKKIPIIHPIFEAFCGGVFALAFIVFKMTPELLIALTFLSMLLIIIVSDLRYLIIPDEVLIIGGLLLFLETIIFHGFGYFGSALLNGGIAFIIMFLIKQLGDFIFKKESMGGGDIKLLFFFGFCLSWQMSLLTIFLGSLIGLPISLMLLKKNKTNVVPFGPFLSLGAMIILFLQFDVDKFINLF